MIQFGMRCHDLCPKMEMEKLFEEVKANNIHQVQLAFKKSITNYDFSTGHYSAGFGRYIRSLLEAGEVRRAAEFLGHYFSVEGTVCHGEGIGKKSLFPTANLIPEEHIIALKRGVYATRAHLPNGETCVGVTNVGVRPTVSDKNTVTIETYLVGFDGDLYGQKLQLDFFDYLREEKKFSSTQELHDMIAKNAREAEMIVK